MRILLSAMTLIGLALAPASALAVFTPGDPAPLPGFDPDSGAELFLHGDQVVSIEVQDTLGFVGAEFGFYFAGDPGTLIPIFSGTDQAPPAQSALIDFNVGIVIDVDAGGLETIFATSAGPIGFYYSIPGLTLYTQAGLNPGGLDLAGTFQATGNPGITLFAWELADQTVALEIATNITPLRAIPEPSAALLFPVAMAFTAAAIRRRNTA